MIRGIYTTSDYFLLTFFTEDLDFEEVLLVLLVDVLGFERFLLDLFVDDLVFDDEYRSPGWERFKKNKLIKWKK